MRRIGPGVKELRGIGKLGARDVADLRGGPRKGVIRIEAGIDGVSLPGFERLVAAMGWNMDVFAVREDEEPNR